ncbi:MAG TPA: D-alanine--D-alanine ligase, partial [Candidatus Paceibacterota bacterium]|nr:D-alanine--D-alanine ligase [Candidatus Paceibacterota bacterium]
MSSSLIRVGVMRGGLGSEYEVSLKTGATVLEYLPREKYQPRDILITKDGQWHMDGFGIEPARLRNSLDVVFNALHGEFGEDGQVQTLLDNTMLPYTGSGRLASALGMNKVAAKEIISRAGLKVPRGVHLKFKPETNAEAVAYDVFLKISPPWIVKPVGRGSSVGVFLAKTFDDLVVAVSECFKISEVILVEEYIRGREATCGVVDDFRGHKTYPLLPIEIAPPAGKKFFDYEAKYSGQSTEICPGQFSVGEKRELGELAAAVHKLLGLKHYSRTDFIVSPRGIYILEVNSLPGLTAESLVPKSLAALGVPLPHFLDHVVSLALG